MSIRDHGLEKHIKVSAEHDRRVKLVKIPTPVTIFEQNRGAIKGRLSGRCACDFLGWIVGGHALYIEAKATATNAHRWRPDERLKTYQLPWLIEAAGQGVICAVYLRHNSTDYLIPVTQSGLPFTATSVLWEGLVKWAIPRGRPWMDAIMDKDGTFIRWGRYLEHGWAIK